jgi:hypothetical protein
MLEKIFNPRTCAAIAAYLNNPLHTEPRAERFGNINIVRRGPVTASVLHQGKWS